MQQRHTNSPPAKKFKTVQSVKKIMTSVFWNKKGILLIDFLPQGQTIKGACYCETLKKLCLAIKNKRREMSAFLEFYDNAHPHTARLTVELLEGFLITTFLSK